MNIDAVSQSQLLLAQAFGGIADVLTNDPILDVSTRSIIATLTIPAAVTGINVSGYATVGDGGAAVYYRVSADPGIATAIQSADGAWWQLAAPVYKTTVTITPPSDDLGLVITQSGVGTNNGAAVVGIYNQTYVTDARIDFGISPFTVGQYIRMDTGGAASRGSKIALRVDAIRTAANNPAFADGDLIGSVLNGQTNTPNGGTNTGAGARGTVFGCNPGATLGIGATNYFSVSGGEIDVGIDTGASAKCRLGWSVVGTGNLQGASIYDAAFEVSSAGTAWKTGFMFSSLHGTAPVSAGGTLIGTDGVSVTVLHGIDFSGYTFTGSAIATPGFAVSQIGNVSISDGSTQPSLVFHPSSGSTRTGQIYQFADSIQISASGIADWISLLLTTGLTTFFGPILISAGNYMRVQQTIVASLPAAATAGQGARAFVSDSNQTLTAGIGTAVATGGSNKVPVYSDGTIWLIG